MIIGMGTDMVDARRIAAMMDRFGPRFTHRLFTPDEIAYAEARANPHLTYAKRFAAKEAVAKALGTGIRGFTFADIEVVNDAVGKPSVILHAGAAARLTAILTTGLQARIHLSLTDEAPYALAWVIIESLPSQSPITNI